MAAAGLVAALISLGGASVIAAAPRLDSRPPPFRVLAADQIDRAANIVANPPRPVVPAVVALRRAALAGPLQTVGGRSVAFTFDDGPDPRYTPKILDLLKAARIRATFCVVGTMAQEFPGLIKRIAAEGHTLCSHAWNHELGLGGQADASIRANLLRANAAIRAAVPHAKIAYFRQPGGAWTNRVVAVARELGMTSLGWAVDPKDWQRPGAAAIVARVRTARPGEIVLMHDGGGDRSGTVAACRALIPDFSRRYGLVSLPQ